MDNPYTDRDFLTQHFYANNDDLSTRIRVHERYTEPRINFTAWVLDQIGWDGDEWVLDAGCGAAAYLAETRKRLVGKGLYFGGDISFGMLHDVAEKTRQDPAPLVNLDIQRLPFTAGTFDIVLANHMLYHVPDIPEALEDIYRVLRNDGTLLAATNAARSQVGFRNLILDACNQLEVEFLIESAPAGQRFSLEEGHLILQEYFADVQMRQLDSALVFRTPEPPADYINSMRHFYLSILPPGCEWLKVMSFVRARLKEIIEDEGEFRVEKRSGVFIARK